MKVRLRATKLGKVRFTSHRDAARIWERSLRKAGLAVAATEGFTPRPKISFGLALPTGAESIAEYVDIEIRRDVRWEESDTAALPRLISDALPFGFDVVAASELQPGCGSLQEVVTSCTWELWGRDISDADHSDACGLLAADELVVDRERKGKRSRDDVRPMILDLRPSPDGHRLVADLATVGRALRPSELAVLAYPDIDPRDVRLLRTHQWIDHDDGRRDVLAVAADVDARTLEVPA